ncbi:MAG: right-handed parallel beta-helix repeat-containing protein, partial [Candidatus Kariarchaeaceae archaeon]
MSKRRSIVLFILLYIMVNSLLLTSVSSQQSIILQQDRTIKVLAITNPGQENSVEFEESEFNVNFAAYGTTKIIIDRTTAIYTTITSELLSESQVDVLYLHNLDGRTLSVDEQNAIIAYVSGGHGIVGTHGTLRPDHALLAPLFGINPNMVSSGDMVEFPLSTTMNLNNTSHPLLVNMPDVYDVVATVNAAINGQPSPWSDDPRILAPNGDLLATSTDGNVAIIYSEVNSSVYLTNNPADSGSPDDMTLLYNALSWSSLDPNNRSHGPISITSDEDFVTLGFPGSGTKNDPYLIEGYEITGSSLNLISIRGTTSYFIIRNCLLDGLNSTNDGITLSNVENGIIENNTIFDMNDNGIIVSNSNDNHIFGNHIYRVGEVGIIFFGASRNLINYNMIYNNDGDGIWILSSGPKQSVDNRIEHNVLNNNGLNGLTIGSTDGGIVILNNTVRYNYMANNLAFNFFLNQNTQQIVVEYNDFILEELDGPIQGSDNGIDNIINYNYWNNWNSPDINGDGIVDEPYLLDGDAGNADNAPLVERYNVDLQLPDIS